VIVPGTLSLHRLPYGDASVMMIVSASDELCDSNGWRSSLAGTLVRTPGRAGTARLVRVVIGGAKRMPTDPRRLTLVVNDEDLHGGDVTFTDVVEEVLESRMLLWAPATVQCSDIDVMIG